VSKFYRRLHITEHGQFGKAGSHFRVLRI